MSQQPDSAAADPDPDGWRPGAVRVAANAALVLFAFEIVTLAGGAVQTIVTGATIPAKPIDLVTLATVFIVIRWLFVLPAMLPVLLGIEYVARRAPHARVLTAIVAFAPMLLWELLSQSPGVISPQGVVLAVTALLFAVVARLPARSQGRSTEDRGAARPPAGPAIAPR